MMESQFLDLQAVHGGNGNERPATLTWQELTFAIGEKEILKNVTGLLEPGRLTAVMGPSGSGKTTLLNVLSGRQRTCGKDNSQGKSQRVKMSGQVFISGEEMEPANYRHRVAYVYQDSALPPCETPRECLNFSAYLRLPAHVSAKDRQSYVEKMLRSLNLQTCADTIVGSALQKGISGGQQKRTAVGVELISNPKLLFLDEPLSGLDFFNARELVASLKDLTCSGVPVLMTLHQPSSEIFAKLDDVVILHQGEVCFHGLSKQLASHFRTLGFNFPPNHNPADDVLFLIQQESQDVVRSIKDGWLQSEACRRLGARAEQFSSATRVESNRLTSSSESSGEDEQACIGEPTPHEPRKGCCSALRALLERDARGLRRQFKLFFLQLVVFKLLIGLLYGLFFYQQGWAADDPNTESSCLSQNFDMGACTQTFWNHFSALSLISMTVVIESMGFPMTIYQGERSLFLRESAGGYYHVFAYFLSKTASESMFILVESVVLVLGTYWLVGFRSGIPQLVFGMWMLAMSSSSMMWCVAVVSSTREQASALGLGPWIMQFAFSGLLVPIRQIPVILRWLRWICPLYYGLGFLADTEFRYLYVDGGTAAGPSNSTAGLPLQARGVVIRRNLLEGMEINFECRWWPYFVMCCVLFVAYRTLALVIMWRTSRYVV